MFRERDIKEGRSKGRLRDDDETITQKSNFECRNFPSLKPFMTSDDEKNYEWKFFTIASHRNSQDVAKKRETPKDITQRHVYERKKKIIIIQQNTNKFSAIKSVPFSGKKGARKFFISKNYVLSSLVSHFFLLRYQN